MIFSAFACQSSTKVAICFMQSCLKSYMNFLPKKISDSKMLKQYNLIQFTIVLFHHFLHRLTVKCILHNSIRHARRVYGIFLPVIFWQYFWDFPLQYCPALLIMCSNHINVLFQSRFVAEIRFMNNILGKRKGIENRLTEK